MSAPLIDRRRLLLAASSLPLARPSFAQQRRRRPEEDLQVRIENKSAPELCAEKDNIELDFVSPRVRAHARAGDSSLLYRHDRLGPLGAGLDELRSLA